jgi:hypothetical protein
MAKYLDENGLLYFWGKIKSYVATALSGSGFYTKPSGGIPSTDLSSAVQTSLGKADTAIQSETVKSVDTTAGTSGINLSLSSAGKLDVTISSGSIASGNSNFVTGGTVYSTTSTLAPKASPALTGTPTAPTAAAGTDTTQIATTAFVTTAIANASVGAATFKGVVSSGTAISSLTDYKAGWYWIVDTAGTYVGQKCEPGDFIYCISDYSSSYKASDFSVVQTNLDIAAISNAEIDVICSDGSMTGPN